MTDATFKTEAINGSQRRLVRLGTVHINFYLLEADGRFTLFDSGLPGYLDGLVRAMQERGADLSAIEAVVLTHAHPDHFGLAETLRAEAGARVLVHEADAIYATSPDPAPSERPPTDYLGQWAQAEITFQHATANGAAQIQPVGEVETFTDGAVLDVPGRPLVIATAGHTPGQSSLFLRDHGALIVGDTLEGFNVLTGRYGPQIAPAGTNTSTDQALASLERLEGLEAQTLLFGHGDPWLWGIDSAVAVASALGPS
jgi:glyoxylase-like metal-dependent hydrolase (beta-lactamase superfamily II)